MLLDTPHQAGSGALVCAAVEQPEQDDPEVTEVAEAGEWEPKALAGGVGGAEHHALKGSHDP